MNRMTWLLVVAGAALAGAGCSDRPKEDPSPPVVIPPHVVGTVGEYALYDSSAALPVQGYGLVVGLGTNGSREVPSHLREYFVQYLARQGLGSEQSGLGHLPPSRMLQDLDTAVVLVGGSIPFGAPQGARFDLSLSALTGTQTRSLQGGILMPTELRFSWMGLATPGGPTKVLAEGGGAVFVNPFIDANNETELVRWREGRLLGGGKVVYAHPVHLQLRRPDYARADLIRRRINETFPGPRPVAHARDRSVLELTVPAAWRDDYEHFLRLVLRIPLVSGAQWETHSRAIIQALEQPGAAHEELALVLEATGRNVVPLLKPLYTSRNRLAAFYAARAGLRLGDGAAEEVIIRFAADPSAVQIAAIAELGRHRNLGAANSALRALVDDENSLVRIAAYEALVRRGDTALITRIELDSGPDVERRVKLDLVRSARSYVIYATQSMEPRIALFGSQMTVSHPIFFSTPDELVTIRDVPNDPNHLAVFRKLSNGRLSDTMECDLSVRSLLVQLASRPRRSPEGKMEGLGLTYGQVVGVLHQMCQSGDIRASFSLQPAAGVSRIHLTPPAEGRPDVPGE